MQPEPDRFDSDALVHYAEVADAIARRAIEPICALNHVTLPAWFASQGGWSRRDSPEVFARFVERVVEAMADRCTRWIPLFEPEHLVTMAWLEGLWPPGKTAFWSCYAALNHLLHAHAESYEIIHRIQPDAEVGVSVRARNCVPLSVENAWDLRAARREMHRANNVFPDALCRGEAQFPLGGARRLGGAADFIAVSYFGKETVRFHAGKPLQFFRSATDSAGNAIRPGIYNVAPEGLWDVLKDLAQYEKPLLVAGNGVNTADDSERCSFIARHLDVLHEAIANGIDVRGYLHRSFLDGFEWIDGYSARYGLVHVDRETLARTPNPSAYFFKDILRDGNTSAGYHGQVRARRRHEGAMTGRDAAVYLAFDGGGTTTRAALYEADGNQLADATGGPSNPVEIGVPRTLRTLSRLGAQLLAECDASSCDVAAGISGARNETLRNAIAMGLVQTLKVRRAVVASDVDTLLHANVGDAEGMVVIAGTGSSVIAKTAGGKPRIFGGRGTLFGDAGSAYDIAVRALRAAAASLDGLRGPTKLIESLPEAAGLQTFSELIGWSRSATKNEVAALAPAVIALYRDLDDAAYECVSESFTDLLVLAASAAHETGLSESAPVFVHGGVFTALPEWIAHFESAMKDGQNEVVLPSEVKRTPFEGTRASMRLLAKPTASQFVSDIRVGAVGTSPDLPERNRWRRTNRLSTR